MSKGKVIIRHKVKDFNSWKSFFVGDAQRQRDAGFTHWTLTRNKHDQNEVIVIFECADLDKARQLTSDPSLAELMKKAGVVDQPTFFFLEEIENKPI